MQAMMVLHVKYEDGEVCGNDGCKTVCKAGTRTVKEIKNNKGKVTFSVDDVKKACAAYIDEKGNSPEVKNGECCIPCLKGKYQDEAGKQRCLVYPRGRYNDKKMYDRDEDFKDHNSLDDCYICPAGRYNTHGKRPGPLVKDQGQNSTYHDELDDCEQCGAGKYLDDPGKTVELHNGENDCKLCDKGRASNAIGVQAACECRFCSPGLVSNEYGSTVCKQCNDGEFQDVSGQLECKQCRGSAIKAR